jgi:hypothetical protein
MQATLQQRALLQRAYVHGKQQTTAVAAKVLSAKRIPGRSVHENQGSQQSLGADQIRARDQLTVCSAFSLTAELFPAVAASMPITQLQFTPVTALVGGLVLGVAAVGKLAITGRILGISGALKGFVQGSITSWRVLFTIGMLAGGYIAAGITPDAFDVLPATFTVTRAALGGLLVGVGAAIGNGCTSGHGICGNARLSIRSAAYTIAFMASGMAVATFTQSAAAAGIAAAAPPFVWPASDVSNSGALLLASAVLAMLGLCRAGQEFKQEPKAVGLAAELAAGVLFAFGLVYTGMVRPTKVIGFLSPTHPAWDLTLAFVMGGALLIALPGFQLILTKRIITKPYCENNFSVPTSNKIDPKLLLGGLLFGAGWGLTGMCPGPAVVAAIAKPVPQVLAYVAAMMAGMWAQGLWETLMVPASARPASTS